MPLCCEISVDIDASGDNKDYMLSNSPSGFGNMRPCMTSVTAVGSTILYFVEESKVPADIKGDYHIGTLFTSTSAADASLSGYLPTDKETTPTSVSRFQSTFLLMAA